MYNRTKLILQRLCATTLFFIAYLTFRLNLSTGNGYFDYRDFPELLILFKIIFSVASFFTVFVSMRFFLPVYDKKNRTFRDYKVETVVIAVLSLFGISSFLLDRFNFEFCLLYAIPAIVLLTLLFVRHRGNSVPREDYLTFFSVKSCGFRDALPLAYYRQKPPKYPLDSVKIGMQSIVFIVQAVYPAVISVIAIIKIASRHLDALSAIFIVVINLALCAASVFMLTKLVKDLKNEFLFGTKQTPEIRNRLYTALLLLSCFINQFMINAIALAFTAVVFLETFASFVVFNLSSGRTNPKDVLPKETFLKLFGTKEGDFETVDTKQQSIAPNAPK